jgi:predicted RecA/RadA family phage recombinase
MAETFRQDGKAVDVVAPKAVEKGDPTVAQGFFGIAMSTVASGETVAHRSRTACTRIEPRCRSRCQRC